MQDSVTSSGEITDCNQLNTPLNIPPSLQWPSCDVKTKGPLQSQCLVYPLWATVETWRCNMTNSVEEDYVDVMCSYFQVIVH